MKTLLPAVFIFLAVICRAGNSFSLNDHPERNHTVRRPYTSCFFDAGYANFRMLGKNYHGTTFNTGLDAVGKKFIFGFHCGTDFIFNPGYNPNDSLPSPHALHTFLYVNLNLMFGLRLGDHTSLEFPTKINLPFGGKYVPSFYIPAYANDYKMEMVTTGLNCVFRLNKDQQHQNAYIGAGINYRFAFLLDNENVIGKDRNYSGMSFFLFLRFDVNP